MARFILLAVICATFACAAADECFIFDSSHGSGPSGMCKPIQCKDAGVLQGKLPDPSANRATP